MLETGTARLAHDEDVHHDDGRTAGKAHQEAPSLREKSFVLPLFARTETEETMTKSCMRSWAFPPES